MQISLDHLGRKYRANLDSGIDLSTPLGKPGKELRAWGVPPVLKEPVRADGWVGSIREGASVNFYDIRFNPHGNGTHTESYGHISEGQMDVNEVFSEFHFIARMVWLKPQKVFSDYVITLDALKERVRKWNFEALIIKTLDYDAGRDFTGKNPPYFEPGLLEFVRQMGVDHFLTDLPSVDREEDGGQLLSHKAFWNYPDEPRQKASITELIRVPEDATEGLYLLNLQLANFSNDAAPSRPVVYGLEEL